MPAEERTVRRKYDFGALGSGFLRPGVTLTVRPPLANGPFRPWFASQESRRARLVPDARSIPGGEERGRHPSAAPTRKPAVVPQRSRSPSSGPPEDERQTPLALDAPARAVAEDLIRIRDLDGRVLFGGKARTATAMQAVRSGRGFG